MLLRLFKVLIFFYITTNIIITSTECGKKQKIELKTLAVKRKRNYNSVTLNKKILVLLCLTKIAVKMIAYSK